ncbi:2,3-bisphosphoglycerate-independent phosphoglycerate mutase [Candidatus Saccharibacteria bacterium]|nr:2,3-bisphosphoglycerate-independent phosphoglycerate mutase [Candidatus Saccharibacteria bacterium]
MSKINYQGPVVLVVLDGVGIAPSGHSNAVTEAHLDTYNDLFKKYPYAKLGASGRYVGIPDGDMGNSEVGHNAIGAGQIILQRSAAVDDAISTGKAFDTQTWRDIVTRLTANQKTLHFVGIFSDGNVHSHIAHLERMLSQAQKDGIGRVRIHILIDGRDVPPHSEPKFIQRIEQYIHKLGDPDYKIASGGGRMVITADRYENDWSMVEKGWHTHVLGEGRQFASATEAIETFRAETPGLQDQYMPAFVVAENGEAIGRIEDGDACIYIDFRADRAIEMAQAFTYNDFSHFDRVRRPDVYFAGLTEYNEDLHVPEHTLVPPPKFSNCLPGYLSKHGIRQYALSETVKFGHITYYFNGNSYDVPEGEHDEEVPSYTEPFNSRPWMKSAEITDKLVAAIESEQYDFLRVNFPGGDMVGHFAELEPTIIALEAIDVSLRRIIDAVNAKGGITLITADHGNAEELADASGKPKTSHTTNPVPCIFADDTDNARRYHLKEGDFGLANLASTIAMLLGKEPDPHWLPPLIQPIDSNSPEVQSPQENSRADEPDRERVK